MDLFHFRSVSGHESFVRSTIFSNLANFCFFASEVPVSRIGYLVSLRESTTPVDTSRCKPTQLTSVFSLWTSVFTSPHGTTLTAPGFTWEFHQYYREDNLKNVLSMIQGSEDRGRRVETRGVGDGVENGFGVDQVGNVDWYFLPHFQSVKISWRVYPRLAIIVLALVCNY